MSKILEATCLNNIVTCEDSIVIGAEILSEGVGQSEGLLLMEEEKTHYITSNATDIKETIDKLNDLITKIVTVFSSIAGGMTGPTTAPPPTLATDLAAITQINVELTTLKSMLK